MNDLQTVKVHQIEEEDGVLWATFTFPQADGASYSIQVHMHVNNGGIAWKLYNGPDLDPFEGGWEPLSDLEADDVDQ